MARRSDDADEMGEPITDDTFLVMLNSYADRVTYTLPQSPSNRGWKLLMNTDDLEHPFHQQTMDGRLDVAGRSVVLLRELVPAEVGQQPSEQEAVPDDTPELTAAIVATDTPQPVPEETPEPVETASTADKQESTVGLAMPILAD